MSRTTDMKLSGWVYNVNSTMDFKLIKLFNKKGTFGHYIYCLVRNAICVQNGYYAILDNDLLVDIHYKLGHCTKPIKIIRETIEFFGEIGILDKSLLKSNILTSAEIQESWLTAKRAKRARLPENLKYWILDDYLPSDFTDNCNNNNNNCSNNNNNYSNNSDNRTIDKDSNKLVNDTKDIIIDNTAFSKDNENEANKRNKAIIDRINEEMSSEPLNTDKYTVENLLTKFTAIKKDSFVEELELSLFNRLMSDDIRNKYLQMLSNACYDRQKQKYNGLSVDYKIFRAFVNKSKLSKLRTLMWTMEHAENVENEDYYMRGIIVNWVIEMAVQDKKNNYYKILRGENNERNE